MPLAGKSANIKVTAATATSSTDAAFTSLSATTDRTEFQITTVAERHWDRNSTRPVVSVNTTVHGSSEYTVNYVQGKITFGAGFELTTAEGDAVTADVDYLTAASVGSGRSWALNVDADMFEVSVFTTSTDSGWRQFQPNMTGATATIGRFWADETFIDAIVAETDMIVELIPNSGAGDRYEGYARISANSAQAAVDGIVEEGVDFQIDGPLYYTTSA